MSRRPMFVLRGLMLTRGFVHPGEPAADGYEPHRGLDWIRSAEIGVTVALPPR